MDTNAGLPEANFDGSAEPSGRKTRSRGAPLVAIGLISLGVVFLLQATNVLPWSVWLEMWRFWPVLLMVAGVNLLVGRRAPLITAVLVFLMLAASVGAAYAMTEFGNDKLISAFNQPLGDIEQADIGISFGAGTLEVGSLPAGSLALVDADFFGRRAETTISRFGDSAVIGFTMDTGDSSTERQTFVGKSGCRASRGSRSTLTEALARWSWI